MDDPFAYGCAYPRPSRQYDDTSVTSTVETSVHDFPWENGRLLQPGTVEHADAVSVRPAPLAPSSGARPSTMSASPTAAGQARQASERGSVGSLSANGEATGYRDRVPLQ
ncbi:hypothetical protein GCM10028832_01880 [Streptomyces sparsus]